MFSVSGFRVVGNSGFRVSGFVGLGYLVFRVFRV